VCVRLLQLNPGRDAGIKPRVSPRTRGQQLSEALRTLDEGGAGDHDPESLCRHNPRPHRSLPDFANQGRHPLRGLVLLHTPIHGFADSPVAKCLHPFRVGPALVETIRTKSGCEETAVQKSSAKL